MKKDKIVVAIVIGTLTFANAAGPIAPIVSRVYAQGTSQASTKSIAYKYIAKISINDGATQNVSCFNLNGSTYYRIVDLAKMLNMDVSAIKSGSKDAIEVNSAKAFNLPFTEADISNTTDYTERELLIFYDSYGINLESIMYKGNNYIKLRSFVDASNRSDANNKSFVPSWASKKMLEVTPFPTVVNLTLNYNAKDDIISIGTSKTDYQAMFEQEYKKNTGKEHKEAYIAEFGADAYQEYFGGQVSTSNTNTSNTGNNTNPTENKQSKVVATKPEVGTFPAKILIDPNKPAYVDGKPNIDNFTQEYKNAAQSSLVGQCTWYVEGRFEEIFKVRYPSLGSMYDLDKDSKFDILSVSKDTSNVLDNSIAIFGTTHVTFVEYVERDSSGKPVNVYFTEANAGKTKEEENKYTPGVDGKVKVLSFKDFVNKGVSPYKGCITLKQ